MPLPRSPFMPYQVSTKVPERGEPPGLLEGKGTRVQLAPVSSVRLEGRLVFPSKFGGRKSILPEGQKSGPTAVAPALTADAGSRGAGRYLPSTRRFGQYWNWPLPRGYATRQGR